MDLDEKKEYHHKYNKAYYLKNKFTKQSDGNGFFVKQNALGSLTHKKTNIEKMLRENDEKANKFRELLKSQSIS